MVLAAQILEQSRANTIQVLPDARKENAESILFDFQSRGPLLPVRGSQQRERYLRYNVYYHDFNWMVQGAFAGILKKVASTPWEIKGPENFSDVEDKQWRGWAKAAGLTLLGANNGTQRSDIEYWQQVLRLANFGKGWSEFIEMGVDFLRHDRGWMWEIIAPGDPMSDPTGPASGIAYLDTLKCRPTGDPDYPIIYYDKQGKKHLLKSTRVHQLVDMPDGDERRPGYGLCALSRAVSIANTDVLVDQYVQASLDDKPPPGLVIAQGMGKQERDKAAVEYRKEQTNDERPVWGRQFWLYGMDKDTPVQVTVQSFSVAPEKFDYKAYTEVNVNKLALAIGVDVQELWQLTSGNIGSQGQSEILHQKSQGKTIGSLMTSIERAINDVLPEEYEFTFKYRDAQEDQQNAQIAQVWAGAVSSMNDLQPDEKREVLANTIAEVKDAITDANGNIIRVSDLGIQPQEQTVDDNSPLLTLGQPVGMPGDGAQTLLPQLGGIKDAAQGVDADNAVAARGLQSDTGVARTTKDIDSTIAAFEADFSDNIRAMLDGDVERRRFGIVARAQLSKYGRRAYLDGMADGGIESDVLEDDDDLNEFAGWLAEQSTYVTDFGAFLKGGGEVDPESRVKLWVNKSLLSAYGLGVMSADANGLYGFEGDDGEESCDTCQRLKGQVHRLRAINRRNLNPKMSGFVGECGGYNCNHEWIKTTGRAQGNW